MARFYMLTVQPSLFGEWCLVREWGRIGSPGRVTSTPFPSPALAEAALDKWQRQKVRKGTVSLALSAERRRKEADHDRMCSSFRAAAAAVTGATARGPLALECRSLIAKDALSDRGGESNFDLFNISREHLR